MKILKNKKQPSPSKKTETSTIQESEFTPSSKEKSKSEIKLFLNLFKNEKLSQFKFFIKVKNPSQDVLEIVKRQIMDYKKSKPYIQALNDAMKQPNLTSGAHGLFSRTATKKATSTQVEVFNPVRPTIAS